MDLLKITFFVPNLKHFETGEVCSMAGPAFVPISVTGTTCSLMCDHCSAKILESMFSAETPDVLKDLLVRLAADGCTGALITGGSDAGGRVPLEPFEDVMKFAREELGLRIAVHTGIVSRRTALSLKRAKVAVAMTDIVGSAETLNRVCHLPAGPSAYLESLLNLADAGVPMSPHVVIGLDYGHIRGEMKAIDMIASVPVNSAVLVVLKPTRGTPMEGVAPPVLDSVREVFAYARSRLVRVPLLLGCARPPGSYGHELEKMAVDLGFDGIAYPSDGLVSYAAQKGYSVNVRYECCSMVFETSAPHCQSVAHHRGREDSQGIRKGAGHPDGQEADAGRGFIC
ncbi:MAG TPA: radical SAM protein [Firmicutes bacterium]|nr:radical SAM protein [Bacillota bacterium]